MKIMSLFYLFSLLIIVTSSNAQRINKTINSGWLFHKGDVEIKSEDFSSAAWSNVNLPHTWNNADAFDEDDGFYQGPGWYAKVITVPEDWKDKQVFLDFEGANQEAEVYINRKKWANISGDIPPFVLICHHIWSLVRTIC